jgi:hypothetical protein
MGRYNQFEFAVQCPHCGHLQEMLFQADVGSLEWRVFELGEQVLDIPVEHSFPVYGAGPDDHDVDYWSIGLAVCLNCHRDIWAKVCIRNKRFDSLEILAEAPTDIYGWGYL